MKVFVIFLFFLGLYLITITIQNQSTRDEEPPQQQKGVPKVSQLYSEMFDMSGPWVEKFIYNHPEEPQMKEPEKEKMSF